MNSSGWGRWWLSTLGSIACLVGANSCLPQPKDDEPARQPDPPSACELWQSAYCQRQGLCQTSRAPDCADRVDDVVCYDDAPLAECISDLDKTRCAEEVLGCEPFDVAEVQRARRACEDYKIAYCEWFQACNPNQIPSPCKADLDAALDCNPVYAVEQPEYADCLTTLETQDCLDLALPEVCKDIFPSR